MMLLDKTLSREVIIHPIIILLHFSERLESIDIGGGLGVDSSTKLNFFFAIRPIIIKILNQHIQIHQKLLTHVLCRHDQKDEGKKCYLDFHYQ